MDKQELKFQAQLEAMKDKHRDDLSRARDNIDKTKIAAEFESMFTKQQAAIQSLIDKGVARVENANIRASVSKRP